MDTAKQPNLRARKRQRTEEELATAAMELFAQHGYDNVTVEQIAEKAWVSPRTYFRYFSSKEDVLWRGTNDFGPAVQKAILDRPRAERPLDAVREAMVELTDIYGSDPEEVLLRAKIIAGSPTLRSRELLEDAQWEAAVESAVAERLGVDPTDDMTPAVVAAAAGAALRTAYARWVSAGGNTDLRELITQSLNLLREATKP